MNKVLKKILPLLITIVIIVTGAVNAYADYKCNAGVHLEWIYYGSITRYSYDYDPVRDCTTTIAYYSDVYSCRICGIMKEVPTNYGVGRCK